MKGIFALLFLFVYTFCSYGQTQQNSSQVDVNTFTYTIIPDMQYAERLSKQEIPAQGKKDLQGIPASPVFKGTEETVEEEKITK